MGSTLVHESFPFPPFEFQTLVCGPGSESNFSDVGQELVEMLTAYGMLGENVDLLDVGCGCGRMARFLLDRSFKSYSGFDRHPGMITWCNEVLTPRDARLRFELVDVRSVYVSWDQHGGREDASGFVFPYADGSFDSAVLASVFTHMPMAEVRHYLCELRRVLRPGGRILMSVFLSAGQEYRRDDVNFFFNQDQVASAIDAAGLTVSLIAEGWTAMYRVLYLGDGKPRSPVLAHSPEAYGYTQHWYVLTRAA